MEPQAKRRRSDSDAEGNTNGSPSDISQLKPHEAIWFNDGNIILATDVHLYRVHKSILAKNSSTFKDMFETSSGTDGQIENGVSSMGEEWEGVPVVKMVDNTDESVYHLLMTLYDRDYYRGNKPAPFSTVVALLRLSTKYDIPSIRREVIDQLSCAYPSSLEEYEKPSDMPLEYFYAASKFQLLASARQCDVQILLPCVFYCCACEGLERILNASNQLSNEDFRKLITGRDKLLKLSYGSGTRMLFPRERCEIEACSVNRAKMLVLWTEANTLGHPSFDIYSLGRGLSIFEDQTPHDDDDQIVCSAREKKSAIAVKNFLRELWDNLPTMFELGDWASLKAKHAL